MSTLLDKDGVVIDASTIRFERLLPGPIERVWAYLTESDKRKQWFAAGDYELKKGGKAQLFFQHFQMLRDRWRAHVELRRDRTGGKLLASEHLDDLQPCRV